MSRLSCLITMPMVIAQLALCFLFSQGAIASFYFAGIELALLYLMLFIAKPKTALMAFLLVRPVLDYLKPFSDIRLQEYSSINLAALSTVLILFCGIFYILIHKINPFRIPLVRPFFAFVLICLFTLPFSSLKVEGLFDGLRLTSLFVFYILVSIIFDNMKDIRRLTWIIFLSAVLPLATGFYQILTRTGSVELIGYYKSITFNRAFATFTHPNVYAFYLTMLLPMAILIFPHTKNRAKKIFLGALIAAMGVSLVLTFTRGAWISFICAVLALGFIRSKKAVAIILLVIMALALFMPSIALRFSDLSGTTYDGTDSLRWRLNLWGQTFNYFLSRPIFGYGLGSFYALSSAASSEYAPAHNDYLRLALEVGIVGLGAYLFLLYLLTRDAFRLYKRLNPAYSRTIALGFFSLCVAYILIGMADNLMRSTVVQLYFWAFAAIMFNAGRMEAVTTRPSLVVNH